MQIPSPRTPVSRCLELSLFAKTALTMYREHPPLMALAETLHQSAERLKRAEAELRAAEEPLIVARATVKLEDLKADAAVRSVGRRVEDADGRKGGRFFLAVFPEGITPIVKPIGGEQLTTMRSLEARLASSKLPEAASLTELITKARTSYEAALSAREEARRKVTTLLIERDSAKEDFLDVYAAAAAKVKAEFPRDRPLQDVFFDEVTGRGARSVPEPDTGASAEDADDAAE